jgi:hypothetical protein
LMKDAGRQRLPAPHRSLAAVLVRGAWSPFADEMAPARAPSPP